MKKMIVLVCIVLFFLVGCVENNFDGYKDVEWKGVLLDAHVDEQSSWVLLDTEYGELKKIWTDSYPVLDTLEVNQSYVFLSKVKINDKGYTVKQPRLVEILDDVNVTIWEV